MSTRFYCNSESCTHGDKGPFVLELAQEAVMDGNNMATSFIQAAAQFEFELRLACPAGLPPCEKAIVAKKFRFSR